MSKLYLTADTDMIKTSRTARGNRRVDASIGYDEGDYSNKIRTTLIRDGDDIELTVFDKRSEGLTFLSRSKWILTCKGNIDEGIVECKINQMYTVK